MYHPSRAVRSKVPHVLCAPVLTRPAIASNVDLAVLVCAPEKRVDPLGNKELFCTAWQGLITHYWGPKPLQNRASIFLGGIVELHRVPDGVRLDWAVCFLGRMSSVCLRQQLRIHCAFLRRRDYCTIGCQCNSTYLD